MALMLFENSQKACITGSTKRPPRVSDPRF